MLTVKEVAERLRVSLSTIYALVEEGSLPCRRIGQKGRRGCVRIAEEDLQRYLDSVKVTSRP